MENVLQAPASLFQLGARFRIYGAANEIALLDGSREAVRHKIEPRAMEVLLALIAGQGKVVSRDRLIEEIWNDYGGGEEGLIQAVSKLRKAFQDDARSPQVIETIPKRGYRLLLPAQPITLPPPKYNGKSVPPPSASEPIRQEIVIRQVGLFTGFIERLTQPRFLLAFLVFSAVLIVVLGILSYIIFWTAILVG